MGRTPLLFMFISNPHNYTHSQSQIIHEEYTILHFQIQRISASDSFLTVRSYNDQPQAKYNCKIYTSR
jgi:hypothetical protein